MKNQSCLNSKLILICTLSFVMLAILAHFYPYFAIDLFISQKIQSIHLPGLYSFMWLISLPGNTNFLPYTLAIILTTLLVIRHRLGIITSLIGVALSVSISAILKFLVHRPRPSDTLISVFDRLKDLSFPSSHAMSYSLVLGFLIYLTQKEIKSMVLKRALTVIFSLLIILVGVSRLYLGVHWFSDVIGGYLLGIICLHFTICLYRHFKLHSLHG